MRSCAGKALAPSAKVGIPIQVTQSFWIVVPPTFVRTIEILFPDTPDYVAAVGHASGWKHKHFWHGSTNSSAHSSTVSASSAHSSAGSAKMLDL